FLRGGSAEAVGVDLERDLQGAAAQDFEPAAEFPDHARLQQRLRGDLRTGGEAVQLFHVDRDGRHAEAEVAEPALRKPAEERRLAALVPDVALAAAGARLRAFVAPAARLAVAGAG